MTTAMMNAGKTSNTSPWMYASILWHVAELATVPIHLLLQLLPVPLIK